MSESFKKNKEAFEDALCALSHALDQINGHAGGECQDLGKVIFDVIHEYRDHYKADIEKLLLDYVRASSRGVKQ